MTFPECLALCFATISSQSDSLISSPSFQDAVEYQAFTRYSGYSVGWLTILKAGNHCWFPLKDWLDQSGFTYQKFIINRGPNALDTILKGYSPLRFRRWEAKRFDFHSGTKTNATQNLIIDDRSCVWVNGLWIEKEYGLTARFREQALELDFEGTILAPVRQWFDYTSRLSKSTTKTTAMSNHNIGKTERASLSRKSFEISTWTGSYHINLEDASFLASLQWEAVGHAGFIGFRLFGSATTALNRLDWAGPGLELQWAWGRQQQINCLISPSSVSGPWKISGSNSLMNRTIDFDAPSGIHSRRWHPPEGLAEWSLNHGATVPAASKKPIIVHLLPGNKRIDYRRLNPWGGISNHRLMWNIPMGMIPPKRWNYGYEISDRFKSSGFLGYGLHPFLSLRTEIILEPRSEAPRQADWMLTWAGAWTAGRFMNGQTSWTLTNTLQQFQQQVHLHPSNHFQGTLRYQRRHLQRAYRTSPGLGPDRTPREHLDFLAQWSLPKGYGLKMLRLETPLQALQRGLFDRKNAHWLMQFETWGQLWFWSIPEGRLSWQGRIQPKRSPASLVYQITGQRQGWQAFLQCHLRSGHHFNVTYSTSNPIASPGPYANTIHSTWSFEWKWIGLHGSRAFRVSLHDQRRRWECKGQLMVPHLPNQYPLMAAHGLSFIHLEWFEDRNHNKDKDPDEAVLDATGGFEVPAGIPYQMMDNGTALLGPFPNHSRLRIRLTPQTMLSPGWVSDQKELELVSLPNSTAKYRIALLRSRQISGTVQFEIPTKERPSRPPGSGAGGNLIYALRLEKDAFQSIDSILRNRASLGLLDDSNNAQKTRTLSDGYFEFNDLTPGIYLVGPLLKQDGLPYQCRPQMMDLRQKEMGEAVFRLEPNDGLTF
ncbi:MAG: hypothetical protein ACO3CL_06340 [Bacteroidia bacterium]